MSSAPESTVTVTSIEPYGENKVCITMQMVVDVHRLAEDASRMLAVAAKGASKKKK